MADYTAAFAPLIQGVGAVGGAYASAKAYKSQAKFQKQLYEINKQLAEIQSKDALSRGDRAIVDHNKQVRGLIGSQRVALAAQGIDIESGSALEIQQNSAYLGALDAITIKNNAWREAWGYRTQALNYSFQGKLAEFAGNNAAENTILTGGINAAAYGLDAASKFSFKPSKNAE